MKIGTAHVQQFHDEIQDQSQVGSIGEGDGFQGILLQMLSILTVHSSTLQEEMVGGEPTYKPMEPNLNPVQYQLLTSLEHEEIGTKDVESITLPKVSPIIIKGSSTSKNIIELEGRKLKSLINEMMKSYDGDAGEEVIHSDPMKKLLEALERNPFTQELGKELEQLENDKPPLEAFVNKEQKYDIGAKTKLHKEGELTGKNDKLENPKDVMDKDPLKNLDVKTNIVSEGIKNFQSPQPNIEIQNLKEVANRIVEEIQEIKSGDQAVLKVKLKPEGLGEMEVRLEMRDGELSGKILVNSMVIKGALDHQMENLKMQLRQQNIVLQEVDVDLQSQHQENPHQSHYRPPQQDKEPPSIYKPLKNRTSGREEMDVPIQGRIPTKTYYSKGHMSSLNLLA